MIHFIYGCTDTNIHYLECNNQKMSMLSQFNSKLLPLIFKSTLDNEMTYWMFFLLLEPKYLTRSNMNKSLFRLQVAEDTSHHDRKAMAARL